MDANTTSRIMEITAAQKKEIFKGPKKQGDILVKYTFLGLFVFGLILSPWYDTYTIALGVGGCNLLVYFLSQQIFKGTKFYQYVAGIVFPLFMAQFIYQMHGMFEMHFFAFLGSVVMIGYQDWKLQLPILLTIVVHHSSFAYLQFSGNSEIYFTQLDYMDLETFIFHAVIVAIIVFVCGFWGYDLAKKTLKAGINNLQLETKLEVVTENKLFAEEIADGNLEVEFKNEVAANDELGQALSRMQASLKVAAKNEKNERYITVGVNKLSELFQKYSDQPQMFYERCITFLIEYLEMTQGNIFIVSPDEKNPVLQLKSAYAYDRNKYLEQEVHPGEGLVGQCYLEEKKIYLTNVPQGYMRIKSGLGDVEPGCLIIFPLISNDQILGVIELAGFEALTDEKSNFIDRIAETLAASIGNLRTAESTALLLETSQMQQQQMQEQEEEMRQNLEEMTATQEEMHNKELQNQAQLAAINSLAAYIEFEPNGTIITANDAFLSVMEYSLSEIRGEHHRIFCDKEYAESSAYRKFWKDLASGISFTNEFMRITKSGKEVWIKASYSSVRNEDDEVVKVVKLATDITEQKKARADFEGQVNALKSAFAFIEFDLKGNILGANDNFCSAMGYEESEIVGNHHSMFATPETKVSPEYKQFWKDLGEGKPTFGVFERVTKSGQKVKIKGTYSPIHDEKGKLIKVVKYVVVL